MAATNFSIDMTTDTSGLCAGCTLLTFRSRPQGPVRERSRYWSEEGDAVTYVTGQRRAVISSDQLTVDKLDHT